MKKPDQLDTVLEVATLRRDNALQTLGAAQRELQAAEQQMTQLQDYVKDSQTRWTARASSEAISVTLLQHQQQFLGRIDQAIDFQRGHLQRLETHVQYCQQQLVQAERALASLNKYTERRQTEWQRQADRAEQKQTDEMAANQHRQQAANHPWKTTP